jgi:hypothetical protein
MPQITVILFSKMNHNISVKTIISVSFAEERTEKINKQNTLAIQKQAVKQWQYSYL